jgi:sulfite exporter TauE/SafE
VTNDIVVLAGTSAVIGTVHTFFGPDHYLPFVVLSKAKSWGKAKTALITSLCGLGHVLSSVVLGFIGIGMGIALSKLQAIESVRGEISTWFIITFGFTYFVWAVFHTIRSRPHEHLHQHDDGDIHVHFHKHFGKHTHIHGSRSDILTPWILFIIFIFGPCEPLIPLVMYPAARNNIMGVLLVTFIFGLTTIATMLLMVFLLLSGLSRLRFVSFEKYSHVLAGFTIFLCGIAIKCLGL